MAFLWFLENSQNQVPKKNLLDLLDFGTGVALERETIKIRCKLLNRLRFPLNCCYLGILFFSEMNSLPKKPYVCLVSQNPQKEQEFKDQFSLNNIEVVRYSTTKELLASESQHAQRCLGWLQEHGCLLSTEDGMPLDFEAWLLRPRIVSVTFLSTLSWYKGCPPFGRSAEIFAESLKGRLMPLESSSTPISTDFGWDPYFYPQFWATPIKNHKCSPRNECIARVVRSLASCNFATPVVWVHHPVDASEPISFEHSYYEVADQMFPKSKTVREFFETAIRVASNAGTILRFSKNKRQRVAWVPGGNAGQPANPKPKDSMHEKIYFGHDTLHHTVFDLILTSDDPFEVAVYTVHRLMSELITLPGADMIEVAACQTDGIPYETVNDRKIFEVYRRRFGCEDVSPLRENPNAIRDLLEASVRYGLLGCEDAFGVDATEFRNKYDAYVVQDLLWTQQNAKFIAAHKEAYAGWHAAFAGTLADLGLETVGDFVRNRLLPEIGSVETVTAEQLVLAIFGAVWKRFPLNREAFPVPPEKESEEVLSRRRFVRWATYQMLYFFREGAMLPNSAMWFHRLSEWLACGNKESRTHFLAAWKLMLAESRNLSVINADDESTYSYLYPFFPASYIGYNYSEQDQANVVRSCANEAARLFSSYLPTCTRLRGNAL